MECVDLRREALLLPEGRGQGIANITRERGEHELSELLRGHVLASGIDGDEIRVLGRGFVRPHRERAAPDRADQPQPHSRPELLRDPRLVEPRRADLTRLVRDDRLDYREAASRTSLRHATHRRLDRHLLAFADEARDRAGADVAERRVLEQVADGAQAELREPRADRLPDAGQRVDGPSEIGRTATRRRPCRQRLQAGKARRPRPFHGRGQRPEYALRRAEPDDRVDAAGVRREQLDLALVDRDEPARDCQPEARSLALPCAPEAVERTRPSLRRQARALVNDVQLGPAVATHRRDVDPRALRRSLERVREEIVEHLLRTARRRPRNHCRASRVD